MPLTYRPYAESWKPKVKNPYVFKKAQQGPGSIVQAPGHTLADVAGRLAGTSSTVVRPGQGAPPGGRRGGGNPYADLINNLLNQQRADTKAESIADAASRDAAIRRLLISYGETPDLASLGISGEAKGVLGGVMDDKTRQLAAANTAEGTSIKARLDQANTQALQYIPAIGATKGTLRSGQTGYALGQQGLQDKQKRFDTLNEMLGNVEGAVGSYAANERARQRALAEAEMNAAWQSAQAWGDQDMGYGYDDYGSDLSSMYPEGGPRAGNGHYGGVTDPYWQNLIDYYEKGARGNKAPKKPPKKRPPARGGGGGVSRVL